MHFPHIFRLAVTLTALGTLGGFCPASAQDLTYTLSNVKFSDGATANGFFEFNPVTGIFGSNNITTTAGVTDNETPGNYSTLPLSTYQQQDSFFQFSYGGGTTSFHLLRLTTDPPAVIPGVYLLGPGIPTATNQFVGSGEYASTDISDRLVVSGGMIVTNPAAVPEASTTISFGLLLALGLGSLVIAAKRKKQGA